MTLLVGATPALSVALLPFLNIGRIWWALYHCLWCWLFVAGFAVACKIRGRLAISERPNAQAQR
jgi:hypothetical protein